MGGRRALIICFSAVGRAFVLSCAMHVFACTVCVCDFFILVIQIFFLVLEVFFVRTLCAHNDSLLAVHVLVHECYIVRDLEVVRLCGC